MTFPALLLATSMDKLVQTMFDDTFAGVYRLDWFDWSLLIPYFAILLVLSCYGCHRYEMIRQYLKQKKRAPAPPPAKWETLPRITIQLPLYNERYVVERLLEEVAKMEYPARAAPDPGAGRFHRRHASLYGTRWCENTKPRACRSNISSHQSRTAIRPGHCKKA